MQVDKVKMEKSKAGPKEKMSGPTKPPPHALLPEAVNVLPNKPNLTDNAIKGIYLYDDSTNEGVGYA